MDCAQAISTEIADGVTYGLQKVMTTGSGRLFQLSGRVSAGKTGTSQMNAHTWFAGFTPQVTTVVWQGNPDSDVPQQFITINGKFYRYVYGSTVAGPLWSRYMNQYLDGMEALPIPGPSNAMLNGVPRPVPDVMCLEEKEAQQEINTAGFTYVNAGSLYSATCPEGTVTRIDPEAGTSLSPGASVSYDRAVSTMPSWWTNWPAGWDPNTPPSDWWGSTWPPAEWSTHPPTGWDPNPGGNNGGGNDGGGNNGGGGGGGGNPGGGH